MQYIVFWANFSCHGCQTNSIPAPSINARIKKEQGTETAQRKGRDNAKRKKYDNGRNGKKMAM
jgi:hypothetical protein